jgi:acetoin utilization deacetylase AcuC-like enzyme
VKSVRGGGAFITRTLFPSTLVAIATKEVTSPPLLHRDRFSTLETIAMPRRNAPVSMVIHAAARLWIACQSVALVRGFILPGLNVPCQHHGLAMSQSRLFSSTQDSPFIYSQSSLKHLENTELPDDYSRKWTTEKVKALSIAFGLGAILGVGGEVLVQNMFHVEKAFVLFGSVGVGIGWYFGGGQEVAESERPINGGYDRKLIADRPARLKSVLEYLQDKDLIQESKTIRDMATIRSYVARIHDKDYVDALEQKSNQADRPQRLNPVYSRTLIDQHSFAAALQAVSDWMDSVDNAIAGKPPRFALVRPPSHHACKSKGMGGCLLNSVAIAAAYALDQPGISSVAILDIDAHHGNGIAYCVQDNPRIRYCSLHEDSSSGFLGREKDDDRDPRSPASDDVGPLGNIRNINLSPGTTWLSYRTFLENEAIPFLLEKKPDLLVVAAGFDALDADLTSKLKLEPKDFAEMAKLLKDNFGDRVATGLEGGYCWQNGELMEAIESFMTPWSRR